MTTIMKFIFITLSLYFCSTSQNTNAEYFTAMVDMTKALEVGKELAEDLKTYVRMEEDRLNRIRKVAHRLSTSPVQHMADSQNSEEFLGNPINAYLTVKSLAYDWKSDLSTLLDRGISNETDKFDVHSSSNPDLNNLEAVRARVQQHADMLPGDNDLDGAASALLRLQATYRLSANDLAHGHLVANISCPTLSAAQCLHLGTHAYSEGDFLRAEEWFRVAYNRLWEEGRKEDEAELRGDTDNIKRVKRYLESHDEANQILIPGEVQPSAALILDHLAYSLGRQGRYSEALEITRMLIKEDPTNQRAVQNEAFYVNEIAKGEGRNGPAPPKKELSRYEQETEDYEALCRGENRFPPPPPGSVYCRYYVPHPYYKIGPVKEEILFPEPRVVMWHDLIHPKEIEHMKRIAKPKVYTGSQTCTNTSNEPDPANYPWYSDVAYTAMLSSRSVVLNETAWVPYQTDEVTQEMHRRIASVTGLSLEAAEDLQVANYGIGGHYAPHFDHGRKREKDAFEIANGNRIATIIFYLTDVQAGGATVFNRVGARVVPKKGSAAFWFNLLPNGDGDILTRHAACPVLVGSKWVMNVWFHERGQEFRRPCELEQGRVEIDDGF